MTENKDDFDATIANVVKPFFLDVSSEKLQMSRNLSFASAGTGLVVLFAASQLESESVLVAISLISVAMAIPLFLAGAAVAENHLWGGPECYDNYSVWLLKPATMAMLIFAYFLLFLSLCCFILFLNTLAGVMFIASSIFAFKYNDRVQREIAEYLAHARTKA